MSTTAPPAARVTRLESGLTIVSETPAHMRTVAVGLWARAGARDERPDEHGLSHLLEHMAFKGTRRRTARAIVEEIETVGGDLNAETTVESTAYYARVMGKDIDVALDILADILTEPAFDRAELEREKHVIVQEIGACDDDPEDLAGDLFLATAFPGEALGRPILGTVETVTGFDREAIGAYLDRNYAASGMVLAASGAVDHDRLVASAERLLARLPRGPLPARTAPVYGGGETRVHRRLEQIHLSLGFDGLAFLDPAHVAVAAFTGALGGGMSSRLFQEVREKRGLAYTIEAHHWAFADCGMFGVSAGTGEADAAELVPVVLDEIARAVEDLTEAETERAKAQMRVALTTGYESPGRRTEQMALQILGWGRLLPLDEVMAKIDAVDAAAARAAGRRLLARPPTLVAVGPSRHVPPIERIAERVGAPAPAARARPARRRARV